MGGDISVHYPMKPCAVAFFYQEALANLAGFIVCSGQN